jgi:hypothetical protein
VTFYQSQSIKFEAIAYFDLFNIKLHLFARLSLWFVLRAQRNGVKDTSLLGGSGFGRT